MLALFCSLALAQELPETTDGVILSPGEFDNSGITLDPGEDRLGLLLRYNHGFTPRLEVGTRSLAWISEANASVKVGLVRQEQRVDLAASLGIDREREGVLVSPYLQCWWRF